MEDEISNMRISTDGPLLFWPMGFQGNKHCIYPLMVDSSKYVYFINPVKICNNCSVNVLKYYIININNKIHHSSTRFRAQNLLDSRHALNTAKLKTNPKYSII